MFNFILRTSSVTNAASKFLTFLTTFHFSYLNTLYVRKVLTKFEDEKTVPSMEFAVNGFHFEIRRGKWESTFRLKNTTLEPCPENCQI